MANHAIRINYTWIMDFGDLQKNGSTCKSPIFLGEDAEYVYQLNMYSWSSALTECLHLSLNCLSGKIIPPNKKSIFSMFCPRSGRRLSVSKITNNVTSSIEYTLLRNQVAECVYKGTLTIVCEVTEPQELEAAEQSIYKPFMDNEKFSDVQLIIGEEKYSAHKLVISANSPVFCNMFSHDMKESQSNQVEIEDMDPKIFKELLRYMYTGKVENLEDLAEEVLKGANRYEMEDLKLICEKFLTTKLTNVNVVYYLKLSADYNAAFLKEYCLIFIIKDFEKFVKEDGFEDLVERYPKLAVELVKKISLKYNFELK